MKKHHPVFLSLCETSVELDRNACWKWSFLVHGETWRLIQDKFYKSKNSSHFPNFDVILTMLGKIGHNSRQGFFLEQEMLLDFAAWIDLTSNADKSLISEQRLKLQNTFCFFKTLTTYGFIEAL